MTEYLELVNQIASETEPNAEDVERILLEAGKSFDDLQQSVLQKRERHDVRAQLDRCQELQTHRPKLEKQIEAADRDLAEAKQRHAQVTAPLYARLQEIKAAGMDIFHLRQKLIRTCDNPLVVEPLKATQVRLGQISGRQCELRKKLKDNDAWAKSDRDELKGGPLPTRAEELTERATRRENIVAKCQTELAELEQELAVLQPRQEALEQQSLVP